MNLGHRPAPPSQAPSRLGRRQRQRIVLALVLLVGAVLLGLGLSPTEPAADAGPAKPLALVLPPELTMAPAASEVQGLAQLAPAPTPARLDEAPVPEEDSDDGWVLPICNDADPRTRQKPLLRSQWNRQEGLPADLQADDLISQASLSLRASADPVEQAAGQAAESLSQYRTLILCFSDKCKGAKPELENRALQGAEALAMLARNTSSAQVYDWAMQACQVLPFFRWQSKQAACQSLSPERWAQLAPNSANAWLAVALRARMLGDSAGELSAIHRAAAATDWRGPSHGLTDLLMQALPQGAPARTFEFAMGLAERLPPSNAMWFLFEAETYCSLPMDANRQQLCTALAQQMLRQTDAVEPRRTGAQLAEKLGLAPELWAPARDEVEALLLLKPAPARSATRSAGDTCIPATERVTYFRRMAEVGDLIARREWRARQAAQERSK